MAYTPMAPTSHNKRKIETVDLTRSDDAIAEYQPRKAVRPSPIIETARAPPVEASSQIEREIWANRADEDEADDVIVLSQDGQGGAIETYELYGMCSLRG